MSDEYFGYNRDTKTTTIPSADNMVIKLDGNEIGLAQSFQGQYQHRVEPRFELGSSTLYWVNGQPQGEVSVQRLVSSGQGLLSAFRSGGDACGKLRSLVIEGNSGSCPNLKLEGSLNFRNGVLSSVQVSGQAGGLDISENATFVVALVD